MAGFTTSLAWKTPDTLDRWNSRAVKLNGRTSTHTNTRARARVVWETFSISRATTENTHQHASYALNEFGMMMQNMSQVRRPLQNSILKIQDG